MNKELLSVSKGLKPADLVVTNGKIVNVFSGEIYDGGVAVCGDTIAAVGDVAYCIGEGTKVIDAQGNYLTPGFLDMVKLQFPDFLENQVPGNPLKAEFLLPRSVDTLLKEGKLTVKVLTSADKWYGVTYAADKPVVVAALKNLTEEGKYPDGLWK